MVSMALAQASPIMSDHESWFCLSWYLQVRSPGEFTRAGHSKSPLSPSFPENLARLLRLDLPIHHQLLWDLFPDCVMFVCLYVLLKCLNMSCIHFMYILAISNASLF